MTRKAWLELGPSLLVAAGVLLSTFVAVRTAESRAWVLTAPVLLALALVGADILTARLRGEASGPSPAALLLAGAVVFASAILALRDPALVKMFLPITGAGMWVPLLLRPNVRRKPCRARAL